MTDAFNKNMQIISGVENSKTQDKQLSDADKKVISESYFKLFFNLTYANWLRGKTLGESWFTALSQLEQFVKSKNANNQAALYLRQIFAAHKTKWAHVMMTNKHRDDVLQPTPEQKQKWNQQTAQNVTAAMNSLNTTLKIYDLSEQKNNKSQTAQQDAFKIAAQKMQMLIMLQMKQKQSGMAA